MLKVLSYILCDLDPKVKVIGQKAGICNGIPSTSALVIIKFMHSYFVDNSTVYVRQGIFKVDYFMGTVHLTSCFQNIDII